LPKSKMFSPKLPPCRTKLSKGPPCTISVHNGSWYRKNSVTVNNHSLQWKGCTKLSTPDDGVQKLHTPKHRVVALHMESTRAAQCGCFLICSCGVGNSHPTYKPST
jgi:hypothetical protein